MSNNRKIVILGDVSAGDMENVLRGYGARNVTVTPSSTANRSRINFKQASDDEDRMMIVYEASSYTENGRPVHAGPHTLAMLGAWGEYEGVVAALFSAHEGYVIEAGPDGTLRRVKPVLSSNVASVLAAEAAADTMAALLKTSMPPRAKIVDGILALLAEHA